MKTVILALLLLVVVSQGEALRCNCGGTTKRCSGRVDTCSGYNPVCASITLQSGTDVRHFKSCMKEYECKVLIDSSFASGSCCSTDFCNT